MQPYKALTPKASPPPSVADNIICSYRLRVPRADGSISVITPLRESRFELNVDEIGGVTTLGLIFCIAGNPQDPSAVRHRSKNVHQPPLCTSKDNIPSAPWMVLGMLSWVFFA